jgi:hypothetical protein
MDGFKTLERKNIPVSPGERVAVPTLTIEVGALNETITSHRRSAARPGAHGERSFTVTSEAVTNMPVPRSTGFGTFALLAPGVATGLLRLGGGGLNNVMQDGVSVIDTGGTNTNSMLQMNALSGSLAAKQAVFLLLARISSAHDRRRHHAVPGADRLE